MDWIKDTINNPAFDRAYVKKCGFHAFFRLTWDLFEPGEGFVDNWHIRAICKKLQDIALLRQKGIGSSTVIAVPPGSTKSNIISVAFQPWVWTFDPSKRFLTSTYESGLARTFSAKSRDIVTSEWYQDRWPIKLKKETDEHWSNTEGGTRQTSGLGGAVTGKHGHYIISDDIIKEQLARLGSLKTIARNMQEANDFLHGTLSTRKIGDPAKILVGQMLHSMDPPNVAIKKHGYSRVIFPVHFDPARADPLDERKVKGELLCPHRTDEDEWRKISHSLGPTAARAQLEQDPEPPGGKLLKKSYFDNTYIQLPHDLLRTVKTQKPAANQLWGTYWDMTFKGKDTSDNVCGQVWALYEGKYFLIDQVLGQMGFVDTCKAMKKLLNKYPFIRRHCMEDAANAPAIHDLMAEKIPGLQLIPHGGGTLARTQSVEGIWAAGQIVLPTNLESMLDFLTEHLDYDGAGLTNDDTVSASSLAISHLSSKSGATRFIDAMKRMRWLL